MEFLGIGYQEIFVVLAVLLIFVGPQRLPTVAYQIGRAVKTLQSYARVVRGEFSEEFKYLDEQYKTIKGEVDTARTELRSQQSKWNQELRDVTAPLDDAARSLNVVSITDGQPVQPGYLETAAPAIADPMSTSLPTGDPVVAESPPALPPAAEPTDKPLVF
ncbi:MAG: twin-arginine translocase TatA/TatE family subunit [Dehalococcoidia bacterium]